MYEGVSCYYGNWVIHILGVVLRSCTMCDVVEARATTLNRTGTLLSSRIGKDKL